MSCGSASRGATDATPLTCRVLGTGRTLDFRTIQDWPKDLLVSLAGSADRSMLEPLSHLLGKPWEEFYEEHLMDRDSNGPWGLTYVNEKDDPRKTQ